MHTMSKPKQRILFIALIIVLLLGLIPATTVEASRFGMVDYAYNYDYWSNELGAPEAFHPKKVLRTSELGIGDLSNPTDVFVGPEDKIYILDSNNARVIVLHDDFSLDFVVDDFSPEEAEAEEGVSYQLNHPEGLFVDEQGRIFIADTMNGRIVKLDAEGKLLDLYDRPETSLLPDDFIYQPTALALDQAERIYVIARNVNRGVIELDRDGEFSTFMGAIPVTPNLWDYIWKRLSTEAQRAGMVSFVPTEYNNIALDADGFLYVTSGTAGESHQDPVRRLNLTGTDIMRRNGAHDIEGDVNFDYEGDGVTGPSVFIDVATYDDVTIFSLLDRKRGRIFTYDEDGNLLFIYGNHADQEGYFGTPTALDSFKRGLLVTDSKTNTLTYLEPTLFSSTIMDAINAHQTGHYEEAQSLWKQVLQENSNSEQAYIGLGRTYLRTDEFSKAMEAFKLGNHRAYYSDAFALHKQEVVRANLHWIILGIIGVIVAIHYLRKYRQVILRPEIPILDGLNYAFYVIFHPFDGFYDIKHEHRGNAQTATLLYALLAFTMILRRQLTGFIFNYNNPLKLNVISTILSTLLPYAIWIVANWSLTTLMDGKGKMIEIYTTTAYGLFPMILINLIMIPFSHIMTREQAAFYYFFLGLATVWSFALIFFGMLVIHEYSLGRNIGVTLLTFVGMGLIIFLGLLVLDLTGQMVNFVRALGREIQFRL